MKKGSLLFSIIVVTAIAIYMFFSFFIVVIDAGNVGVVSVFGSVSDSELSSGIHVKNPFANILQMSTRTQEYTMSASSNEGSVKGDDSIEARASDGALVFLDITVLYKLNPDKASDVYKGIGLDYTAKIIRPEVRSAIRTVVSKYQVNEIYSTKRDEMVENIQNVLKESFEARGIILETALLRNVNLTQTLSDSIEQKLTAQQEAQKLDFLLERERKEAERKVIEAGGQRDAQRIITESLTNPYLYYLYINTLKDLEGTIYVPTEGGLPLFKSVQ